MKAAFSHPSVLMPSLKYHLIRLGFKVAMKPMARLLRGMTLGSRVLVIDSQNRVLLVKATYSTHWILPGGGVERGETAEQSGLRELEEEAGVRATGPLQLLGVFSNDARFRGDHLIVYVLREFEHIPWTPDAEIEAAEFFALDTLPSLVNKGSMMRIDEVLRGKPPSPYWAEP
jgi:8-oxo-dGTP pyrophosphatase MutT (NUDIX family)